MIAARTKAASDTHELAAAIASVVQTRDLVLLVGEMGAGKTTFTQGFGKALGIEEPITSPTFVLLRSYKGSMAMHHVDIYRLEHLQEVIDLGLMELLDEGGVALVEWGDLATPVLPRDFLELRLSVDSEDDEARLIELKCVGPSWMGRTEALRNALSAWTLQQPDELEDQTP